MKADPYTVMLDYDQFNKPCSMMELYSVARIVQRTVLAVSQERSSGGKGWHVTIQFAEPMSAAEIVCLQFALGSDNRRETMNLGRIMAANFNETETRWNLLYSQKLKLQPKPRQSNQKSAAPKGSTAKKTRRRTL